MDGSVGVKPNNLEKTKAGIVAKAKPVAPSSKAVMVSNNFNVTGIDFEIFLPMFCVRMRSLFWFGAF